MSLQYVLTAEQAHRVAAFTWPCLYLWWTYFLEYLDSWRTELVTANLLHLTWNLMSDQSSRRQFNSYTDITLFVPLSFTVEPLNLWLICAWNVTFVLWSGHWSTTSCCRSMHTFIFRLTYVRYAHVIPEGNLRSHVDRQHSVLAKDEYWTLLTVLWKILDEYIQW